MNKLSKLWLVFLLIILLLNLLRFTTLAGESAITTNLYSDGLGIYNATYEMPVSDNMTFYGTAKLLLVNTPVTVSGFGLDAGLNYYLQDRYQGMYLGAGFVFTSAIISGGTYSFPAGSNFSFNLQAGYKKIFDNGFIIHAGYSAFNGIIAGVGFVL